MRENYRKSIASIERLPRFTTMNVIDGQAGLAIYASLIFYSLTIDNILNIIVLLILAGVAISMLSGENGILKQAANAKTETEKQSTIEQIKLAATAAITNTEHKIENKDKLIESLQKQGLNVSDRDVTGDPDTGYKVTVDGITQIVSSNGIVSDNTNETKLISFTIDGTTYQAEKGDKWEYWCASAYNAEKFFKVAGPRVWARRS